MTRRMYGLSTPAFSTGSYNLAQLGQPFAAYFSGDEEPSESADLLRRLHDAGNGKLTVEDPTSQKIGFRFGDGQFVGWLHDDERRCYDFLLEVYLSDGFNPESCGWTSIEELEAAEV